MRAINIRIGHDDDTVVAKLVRIKLILTNTTTERRDDGSNFS